MFCSCDECGDFTVPPLIMPCNPEKSFCPVESYCTHRLPPCVKVPVVYCCERPKSKLPPRDECERCCVPLTHQCSQETRQGSHCDCSRCQYSSSPCCASSSCNCKSPSPQSHSSRHECSNCCDTYCARPCKPVRTKYVIPCYRYEDGRIVSFFTYLRIL